MPSATAAAAAAAFDSYVRAAAAAAAAPEQLGATAHGTDILLRVSFECCSVRHASHQVSCWGVEDTN
jgi:hypothetical protein